MSPIPITDDNGNINRADGAVQRTNNGGIQVPTAAAVAQETTNDTPTAVAATVGETNAAAAAPVPPAQQPQQQRRQQQQQQRPAQQQHYKCSIRGCKLGKHPTPMDLCSASEPPVDSCDRKIHYQCWMRLVAKKYPEQIDLEDDGITDKGFCTLACYKRYAQASDPGVNWHNDGKNGKKDQNCSENLLVQILSNQTEYERFRDPYPDQKKTVCQGFADKINSKGVQVKRTAKQVQSKIEALERAMRLAIDFADSATGAGLQETDPDSFERAIMLKCKFYYELLPVFIDRAGMKPSVTTEDIMGNSSSDSDSESGLSDDDDEDEGKSCQQKKKGQLVDLTSDNDDVESQSGGGDTASLSGKKHPAKRHRRTSSGGSTKKKHRKGKGNGKGHTKNQSGGSAEDNTPREKTTDELLRQLMASNIKIMEEKEERRRKRKERKAGGEKKKRKKLADFDLTDYDQFVEVGEKWKRIVAVYDGDKVRAAMQFPEFATATFLTNDEIGKFNEQHLV